MQDLPSSLLLFLFFVYLVSIIRMSYFPLEKTTQSDLDQLGRVLWSWLLCEDCQSGKRCEQDSCLSQRSKRLMRFFDHYRCLTRSYESDSGPGQQHALSTHEDVLKIIQELKSDPDVTRSQFADRFFMHRPGRRPPHVQDQERAINLAVRAMTMINCSAQWQSYDLLEFGAYQAPWRSDDTFSQFITDVFPMSDFPTLNDADNGSSLNMKASLMAKKLKKRAGLKFRPTDDLRSHLRLDRKSGVVDIFHHTAFLKEHLRLTKGRPHNLSVREFLELGALPRQLALEALDSLQKILFPLSDPKSCRLLRSYNSTLAFDPDCLRFESASIRNQDEKDISYLYFGARLADLYEELENPKPRGLVERWLERKSGARYVMMATLIGVVIAVVLGMAGLAVGGYQAWVGYQAWQHPVT